jgi:hypothetical protein
LAFFFAMEAKLECYAPMESSAAIDVHAVKVMPTESRDFVSRSAPTPGPGHLQIPYFLLVAMFAAAVALQAHHLLGYKLHAGFHTSRLARLSPQISFRPPPAY